MSVEAWVARKIFLPYLLKRLPDVFLGGAVVCIQLREIVLEALLGDAQLGAALFDKRGQSRKCSSALFGLFLESHASVSKVAQGDAFSANHFPALNVEEMKSRLVLRTQL